MFIRFSVENFRSIREMQEVSFVAAVIKDMEESVAHPEGFGFGLLKTAAIYGANASGKSNFLKAIEFFHTAVRDSHRSWAPDGPIKVSQFRLGDETARPTSFEVEFIFKGTRYQYGFKLNTKEVLEEWLYAYPTGRRQTWFTRRSTDAKRFTFGKSMTGENRTVESLTRNNSLFLSAAAQNNHELLFPIYKYLSDGIQLVAGNREFPFRQTVQLCSNEEFRKALGPLISEADLGIVDIELKEVPIENKVTKRMLEAMFETIAESVPAAPKAPTSITEIFFLHRGASSPAVFEKADESDGTIAYLALVGPAFTTIARGGLLLVDELDASLHPLLAAGVIGGFNSEGNAQNAQMLFNTHDTNLLSRDILRRDQIWFAEKDKEGATHIYPLTDFKPRKDENLERGYLAGRYGAIPYISGLEHLNQGTE